MLPCFPSYGWVGDGYPSMILIQKLKARSACEESRFILMEETEVVVDKKDRAHKSIQRPECEREPYPDLIFWGHMCVKSDQEGKPGDDMLNHEHFIG
jgi:hypothetical protein